MGLEKVYRYQKYRSYYGWTDRERSDELNISLDETPIGVYMELEGPMDLIDRAAERMGYAQSDYILENYRSLHRAYLRERGLEDGDLVFTGRRDG